MGEIAEGLINGDFDSISGEWLGKGMGFPRTIHENNRKKSNPVRGVIKYLISKQITDKIKQAKVILSFCKESNIKNADNLSKSEMCDIIQDNFGLFVFHVNKYLKQTK